ncbi:hypothetical protein [Algicola sagamiensis]|uniref:hypothetical protein n=1 Tax=Algicola sagamiensis TaxID=163869 RepID=UPI0003656AB3|nr:hypothetical protein [Algicola sagamiensis]
MSVLSIFIFAASAYTATPNNITFACHVELFGGKDDVYMVVTTEKKLSEARVKMKESDSEILYVHRCIDLKMTKRFFDHKLDKILKTKDI